MFYADKLNQAALIIIICFSFFIFAYNLSLNRNQSLVNLLAFIFCIPFTMLSASLLVAKEPLSLSLSITADLLVTLLIFGLLTLKIKNTMVSLIRFLILILPFAAISSIMHFSRLPGFITSSKAAVPLLMATALACLYVLRNEKGNKLYIFWAVICLASSDIIKFVQQKSIVPYLFLMLKFTAYILFTLFFHKEIYSKLTAKIIEAEKKITAVNKSLDLEVRKRVFEIERSNQKLISIAKTDALTKSYNKAAILEVITNLMEAKTTKEFSILMFDIDNFKAINDTLGHLEGDKCIKKLAVLACNSIREIDSLGRYGGDEFIIVLPEASISHAKLVAERFRKKVAETETPHFTISIGLANYPGDAQTLKDLISIADEGLYQSKRKGRNSVSHRNLF